MKSGACRRPNLGDLIILIVASALAMAITRQIPDEDGFYLSYFGLSVNRWIGRWVLPWIVTMTLGSLVIRLRRPRPSLRRVLRQPGFVASCLCFSTAGYAVLVALFQFVLDRVRSPSSRIFIANDLATNFQGMGMMCGLTIAAGWITLALAGRFHRERGWIDGLGLFVGLCWIAYFLIMSFCGRIV